MPNPRHARPVTLARPAAAPTLFAVVVLNLMHGFQVFEHVFALTNGGPGFGTTGLTLFVNSMRACALSMSGFRGRGIASTGIKA